MRLHINAGGLDGFYNGVCSFLSGEVNESNSNHLINSFSNIINKTNNLNGGVGALSIGLGYVLARKAVEESRKIAMDNVKSKIESFIQMALRVDAAVATMVTSSQEEFYKTNPWLRPQTPSSAWIRFWKRFGILLVIPFLSAGTGIIEFYSSNIGNKKEEFSMKEETVLIELEERYGKENANIIHELVNTLNPKEKKGLWEYIQQVLVIWERAKMNKYIKKIVSVSIALILIFLDGCGMLKQTEESQKSDLQESQEIQENHSNLEEQEEITEDIKTENGNAEEKTKLQVKDKLAIVLREESIETSYQVYSNTYDYEVDGEIQYSVPYFQIFGLNNPGLEEKINEVLLKAAIEWLQDNCLWASDSKLQITCQTADFFSYIYMHEMSDGSGAYCYGVTIDLKTGVRLSLDDFLTIDDTFMEQVAAYDYNDEFVFPLSVEESKTMIESALMTELEYLEENGSEVEYLMESLRYKSSFYIKPGDLIIIRDTYDMGDIYYSEIQME